MTDHIGGPAEREDRLRRLQARRPGRRTDPDQFPLVPVALLPARATRPALPWSVPIVGDELVGPADLEDDLPDEFSVVDDRFSPRCCDQHVRYRTRRPERLAQVLTDLAGAGARASAIITLGDTVKGPDHPSRAAALQPHPGGGEAGRRPFVVVIDTGLDVRVHNNGWLRAPDVAPEDAAIDIDRVDVINNATGSPGPDQTIDPASGHGTFVAGLIRRVAPGARIRVLRAFDTDGLSSDAMVAAAICRAADVFDEAGVPGVLNMSFGGETVDNQCPPVIDCALRELPDDVVAVASAGNQATTVPLWPAAHPRVVSVAALGVDGQPADDWSSHGDTVRFSVPGEDLVSTFVKGTDENDVQFDMNDYGRWSGTSFAAAQVSAQIARNILGLAAGEPVDAAVDALGGADGPPGWGKIVTSITLHG